MKQPILITAYKNLAHLQRIVAHFDSERSFHTHIDKKSGLAEEELTVLKQKIKGCLSAAITPRIGEVIT